MITDNDRQILDFIDQNGCITIRQTELMFYKNRSYGYDMARKRLNYLVSIEWLKCYRDKSTNLKVYYTEKKYSYHRILSLDFYAHLVNLGADISFFKNECEWNGGKIRSDAFTGYIFGGKPYFNFVEVITSHNDLNLEKYDKLYETGEVQRICAGKYPSVVLIDNVNRQKETQLKNTKIIKVKFDFEEVAKVFLN